MLTQEDIEDLKKYTSGFNEYCSDHVCGVECEVFEKSLREKKSCWAAYV